MTQLYVGNLSAEGDEKAIRMLFEEFGPVREVLMKNGYSFVEFESPFCADEAMRKLNGTSIDRVGHSMIIELSHQQRRKVQHVTYVDTINSMRTTRKSSLGLSAQQSKNDTDFPLSILIPSDMVGVIFGKDRTTIGRITKTRVDVHRRENLGTDEEAITIIGPAECCTEACYQIMKIMQNELLTTNRMMESGKFHEPPPVVPLKILAHNELVGRVIGKGGSTLKIIMAESETKITISKLKDLAASNTERTITILGTINSYKKAESLISAKLRASYESDMAQFIPVSKTNKSVVSLLLSGI